MTASGADSFRCGRGRACHFIIDVEYMRAFSCPPNNGAAIVKRRKIRIADADIRNFRTYSIAEKPRIIRSIARRHGHILNLVEHAVELARKRLGIRADRGMRSICKVDVFAQHIVARKARSICPDCIESRLILNKLVHIGIREILVFARTAIRRCRRSIAHMHIAFVNAYGFRAAGIHLKRTLVGDGRDILRGDLRIVHDAHALAFEDDRVRLDRAATIDKADDIGLSQPRRAGCAPIDDTAFDPGSRRIIEVNRAMVDSFADRIGIELARRHIEVADIDAGTVAEDDAMRIGDIDVLAALHRAIDL